MVKVHSEYKSSFSNRKFLILMLALIVTILIDTSVVKVNDLIDKNSIPLQTRQIVFSVNSLSCLLLQFFIIRYIQIAFRRDNLHRTFKVKVLPAISLISLCAQGSLIGFLLFQQFYNEYYDTSISISIVAVSYGAAAVFITWLFLLFLSWYKSSRSKIVFLYFVATSVIAFNLIMTATFVIAKIGDRPDRVGEYIGSSGDISGGSHAFLDAVYRFSSLISFFGIWITTVILMKSYRERHINPVIFWVILSIPLIYFLITYSYQFVLGKLFLSYMQIDPITISIILSAFLSLSKPIGGLLFGIDFLEHIKGRGL